jgi:predicted Zn-dependent peptidase
MNKYPTRVFESELLGERYQRIDHPSGLSIYVFSKNMSATYAMLGTKYGSIHSSFTPFGAQSEMSVPDGIAHFLEHKLFANEDGSDSFERFSALGADANAYTGFDKTVYLFSCTHNFDKALAELVTFVTHPYFTDENVKKEIGIISEELKMYEDNPINRCYYGMLGGMYKHHSVRRDIGGTQQSIRQITPDLLYDCYNAFYRPDNMALVVCGNVTADEVMRVVDPLLPRSVEGAPTVFSDQNALEPREAHTDYVEQKMQVAKPLFNIGFKDTDIPKDPRERDRRALIMGFINDILFSKSGELYTSLIEHGLVSPGFSSCYSICQSFAFMELAGEADDPRAALDEILAFIAKTKKKGIDQADFERLKRVYYAEWVMSFDSVEDIAEDLFRCVCEGTQLFEYVNILNEITPDDVKCALDSFFDTSTMTLSVIKPIQ